MGKPVFYVAHPVTSDAHFSIEENIENVKRWIHFLTLADPSRIYIAPWVAEVLAFKHENQVPGFYDRVLSNDEEVVRHCDGILLVGGRVSTGMARELAAARASNKLVADLSAYRTPEDFAAADHPLLVTRS